MQVPAVRERVVAMLANVDDELAEGVADGLGIEVPERAAAGRSRSRRSPRSKSPPALSLFARPGDGSIRTRRIAILVADGVDGGRCELRCTPG